MAELPSGTVTFLFTDIEGSTRLLKQLGERYSEVLADQRRILREAAEARDGREIDTQGDSFFFAFTRANAALGAAVVAQRVLAEHDWPEDAEVRVRMGVHTGEPVVGEESYVGLGVHRAARIGAIGHGGQVLLSNATRELVEEELGGVSVRELGSYRLKDIDRPERLFQLDIEGLQTEFPPLKAEQVAEPRQVRRRTVLIAMLAGVVAAAVAIPIFAFGQGGESKAIEAAAGNSVGFVDPESNKLVADVEVGTTPTDVAAGEGAVWVTNSADGTVDRIDPVTRTVRQTIRVGHGPDGIAVGEGSVWVANGLDGTVSRIDPRSSEVTQTISVGNGPSGVAVGLGNVWVVNQDDRTLSRIDPVTGKAFRVFTVGAGQVDVAVAAGALWVASEADGKVLRVDPSSGSVVESINVGRGPGAIAAAAGSIWVANQVDGTVSRIDPEASAVTATIPVGDSPSGIAATGDAVWVASEQDGSLTRIDPETNRPSKTVSVGSSPAAVATGPEGVFVAVRPGAGAHRGGTLTVVAPPWYGAVTFDPAVSFPPGMSLTNDGLVAFKRVGGREGSELVADLATALPQPTDAGKTYTFRLRKGIRYSTGRPVRAADFRRALERVFALNPDYAPFYASIAGAEACSKDPKGCDLSKGIVADDRAGTVTFHLTEPDPELLSKLALTIAVAVPENTPSEDVGTRPVPATGPYRLASYVPERRLRFVRNPFFREWSRAARPDGYPDEITLTFGQPIPAAVQVVGRGQADLTDLSNSGEAEVPALRARFGSRLHSVPTPFGVYTLLNTRRPPFDDVRVRRALSYALDRQSIVRAAGGSLYASPSCQVLPEGFPGYRPYCPYRRDLSEARRLVAASGTRGTPVVVWTRASYQPFYARVVVALRDLGYPARLKVVDDRKYLEAVEKVGLDKIQASYAGWIPDYPTAANYITSLVGYLERTVGYSDPAVKRQIARAQELQQTDPDAANVLWARIDRMITDRAPIAPMYNLRGLAFVSERVGNFQYHSFWYTLLDQLWVR